jgi:hypothetical protein
MEVLNPGGIMVAKLSCSKLDERPAETEGRAVVRVGLAEVEAETKVIHRIISAKCTNSLR